MAPGLFLRDSGFSAPCVRERVAKLLKLKVDRHCLIPPGPLTATTRNPPFVNTGAELIPHFTQDLSRLGYLDSKQSIHSQLDRERGHWGPCVIASGGSAWPGRRHSCLGPSFTSWG